MAQGRADHWFGELLRVYRKEAGLSQSELAERAGLSASAISALERGERRRPYPHTVRMLADALQLPDRDRTTLLHSATIATPALPTRLHQRADWTRWRYLPAAGLTMLLLAGWVTALVAVWMYFRH